MKKIKELSLNVGTTLDQYPGTQTFIPNGYSGEMLTNADSGASRYMQRVNKGYDDEDSELSEEDEMQEQNILSLRVKNKNGYSLNETLANLDQEILTESFIGEKVQNFLKVALMAILDDFTGEVAGLVAGLPILYKNVYELNETNKKIETALSQSNPNVEELKSLRNDLIDDISDIVSAVVIALPIPAVDSVGAVILSMLDGFIIGKASQYLSDEFNKLSKEKPILSKILYVLSYPLGVPVVFTAMKNVDKLSDKLINTTISGAEVVRPTEDIGNPIDVTPEDLSEILNFRIHDILRETLSLEEEEKEQDEDLEEMITTASMAGNPVLPLGRSTKGRPDGKHVRLFEKEKAINEQRERIALLQAYHQKTTNRLK